MSVNLDSMHHKPATCYTVFGEAHHGSLEAIDGTFNVVLLSNAAPGAVPRADEAADVTAATDQRLLFVRGDSVVYVALDETSYTWRAAETMSLPGVARYERIPTRMKAQLFWCSLLTAGFVYQFIKMTVLRVQPKREEQMYMHIQSVYGDNIPDDMIEMAKRQRAAQDALTLTNVLRTPTPGQTSNALQNELDPRGLTKYKSWNGY